MIRPAKPERYISLLELAADWARQSGVPAPLVLRHLCGWAIAGAFPQGAFVNVTGARIEPYDIFMSFRKIADGTASLSGGVHLAGCTTYNQRWGLDLLQEVLLTAQNLLAFCERTDTLPPPSALPPLRHFLARLTRQHLAPPECPDAEGYAVRHVECESPVASLNTMEESLRELRQRTTRLDRNTEAPRPIELHYWLQTWVRYRDRAHREVRECGGDGDLQRRLDRLDRECAALVASLPAQESLAYSEPETQTAPAPRISSPAGGSEPLRVVIRRNERTVVIAGQTRALPEQLFRLFCLLAERAKRDRGYVTTHEIDQHLWGGNSGIISRPASDVIRSLRDALSGESREFQQWRDLIENRPRQGYRLSMSGTEIIFED